MPGAGPSISSKPSPIFAPSVTVRMRTLSPSTTNTTFAPPRSTTADAGTTVFGLAVHRRCVERLRQEADARRHVRQHAVGRVDELHLHADRGLGAVHARADLDRLAAVAPPGKRVERDLAGEPTFTMCRRPSGTSHLDHQRREVGELDRLSLAPDDVGAEQLADFGRLVR